jgi:two-component system, OmpR family, sensor histidine kinase KdpD
MTRRWSWRRESGVASISLLGVALVAGSLRYAQTQPNPTISALLLLLVVLATATTAPLRVALGISVVAMLAFNFFLLPPYHTFTIDDSQNWVVLFVFVVVAIVASHLSAAMRTRTREAETRKREAEAVTQRAALASALLASFSHDLRTPVTSIRVAVTNLQDLSLTPEERQAQADLAARELDRLTRLFQNILDMGRIQASAVTPDRDWISLNEVIEAAVAYVGPVLAMRRLQIDADQEHEVQIDPRLTSVALAHVLENAASYSTQDAPISITASVSDNAAVFIVQDRGPGLDPADVDHVFEAFYRGKKTRYGMGSGLGLAITRGLLCAEGGKIWGENVPSGGARFTIRVPAAARQLTLQES